MDDKCWQEFYCHRCQGGTYIMVRLNMSLNHTVVVVCPLCGSKHERNIENGQIHDRGKTGTYREEICPPKAACSKVPRHAKMKSGARDGAVVKDVDDIRDHFMRQLWVERYGGTSDDSE